MSTRRCLIFRAVPTVLIGVARLSQAQASEPGEFSGFLARVQAEARAAGISAATVSRAFAGVVPNQKVLEHDRHQPEFTMTWARYRELVITGKRIADGRAALAANRALFERVEQRFGVGSGVIAAIWGVESGFGAGTGDYRVIEALATLAWDGRRASFFRGELIAALKILDHGDIAAVAMTGSYAGAMGQPQFMPSSYLRYAVDFDGHGRRDIWTSKPDVLGSIANYLALSGWRTGQGWGQQVVLPAGMQAAGREAKQTLADWMRAGVRPLQGHWAAPMDTPAGLVAPDGAGGDSFAVFSNFGAIRHYNASDYYALAVGLIGDQVTA